jgi:Zn-dependent protease with chaperone function
MRPPEAPDPSQQTWDVLRAWAPEHEPGARRFDDAKLLEYRHPGETRSLIGGLLILAVVAFFGLGISWELAGVIVLALLLPGIIQSYLRATYVGNGAEITARQFSHLYPVVEELRLRFKLPRTRVFVVQSPILNAFAMGIRAPYTIVLHSALIDAMDPLELKSVLGHEMAHIRFGHTRVSAFIGGVHSPKNLPFPLSFLAFVRDFIFLWWNRTCEMTCDRAGVVACGRLSKAVSAQVKLHVGPSLYQHTNVDDLANQATEMSRGWMRFWGFIGQAQATHPFMVYRIRTMVEWAGGLEPGHELRLRDPNALSQAIPTLPRPAPPEVSAPIERAVVKPTPLPPDLAAPPPVVDPSPSLSAPVSLPTTPPPVAPAPPPLRSPRASLVVALPRREPQQVVLDERPRIVGRGESVDVQVTDPSVSRRHFRLYWEDGAFRLEDLGSSNGTKVNGTPVAATELHNGDVIQAGIVRFHLRIG